MVIYISYIETSLKYFLETNTKFSRKLIWALGVIKYAAALANRDLGLLEEELALAIADASLQVASGCCDEKIQVDVLQTGSGTGLNMAVNELIAGLATRILGRRVHSNNHVNLGQSSNDVIPSAIRIAALSSAKIVLEELEKLIISLKEKAEIYEKVIKPGRTHLRDALPVTLGMELDAYADSLEMHTEFLRKAISFISRLPLGGTAVGTGLNTDPKYPSIALHYIREATGLQELIIATRKNTYMMFLADILHLSSTYKSIMVTLYRLSQDFRIMYSGPVTGYNEIDIEIELPGSSMMPGKKNPVTLEALQQAYALVSGLEASMEKASILGEFELSMGIPLAGYVIDRQATIVAEALRKARINVVEAFRPRVDKMRKAALKSPALLTTILAPIIGYDEAARLVESIEKNEKLPEQFKKLLEILSKTPLEDFVKPGYTFNKPKKNQQEIV